MLPCRSGRFLRSARLIIVVLLAGSCLAQAGDRKRRRPGPKPAAKEEVGLKSIPLAVGHEAKGLILPNYDLQGRLLGRFEAATAARLDEDHVRFTDLKMTTFDAREQPDFDVNMTHAILNLETRVIDSKARTKVKRADFEIAGDTMSFNTMTKLGTLVGNVHMTVFNQKQLAGSAEKP